MIFGFVSVRVLRYVTAALMASPVGVPMPAGVVAVIWVVTGPAFLAAMATGMALVTEPAAHDIPSPSGKTLRPQETEASVAVTTSLTPGTTRSHLVVPTVPPVATSFI